jgi:hypothetical protein
MKIWDGKEFQEARHIDTILDGGSHVGASAFLNDMIAVLIDIRSRIPEEDRATATVEAYDTGGYGGFAVGWGLKK